MNQPPAAPPFPYPPQAPQQPTYAPAVGPAPQYAPGYQPMPQGLPQQPTYPQPAPYGLPQAGAGIQHDVDSATSEGSRYPHPTYANGAPWLLNVHSITEFPSFHGGKIVSIDSTVRQSPDPNFPPGMTVNVQIKGLEKGMQNNPAQSRLKKFLASVCNEPEFGQAPGHFAARKQQALAGQLNGLPYTVSFSQHTGQAVDPKTGQRITYLRPIFQAG